ncbi:restriction endonuclease subunit S [Streptomyces sp. NPDC004959]|uniref:restriction endonuclease subunit S n=1 Tax=Streptomyces sp. NPDC004959 TaxID=3154673 RepID=UPI0033BF9511
MKGAFEDIPQHWQLSRVDRVASVNARIGWKALTAAEYQDEGYAFLSTPNIKLAEIDFENVNFISEFRYEESPDLKLTVGDVLLAKDGNTLGIVNIVRDLPRPATVNGSIAVLRAHSIEPNFLRYVIASDVTQSAISAVKGGMGVPHLFQWDINRLAVPLPPAQEQRLISNYLDAEVACIEEVVRARRAQLNLLDRRLSVVRDVLVGEYSEKFPIAPLRRFIRRIEQGASPQCDNTPAEVGEWGVLKLSSVKRGTFIAEENKRLPEPENVIGQYEVKSGDLLVTRANTPDLVGDVAVVRETCSHRLLPDLIYRVSLDSNLDGNYVAEVALGSRIRELVKADARGSSQSMVKLRGEDIKNWPVPVADELAQQQLVSAMREATRATAQLKSVIQRQINLLTERRRSLITAAVTGQIDVVTARGVRVP